MSITNVNPRSIADEGPFITTDVAELASLKARLIAAGQPAPFAAGVISWLVDKAAGQRDETSSSTRARYRKALRDLAGDGGPKRGRRLTADNPRGVRYVGQRVGRRERRSAVMARAAA